MEQFFPSAGAFFGFGIFDLAVDKRFVGGALDAADHTDGSGEIREAHRGEELRIEWARVVRLVDEDFSGSGRRGIDDFGHESIEADRFFQIFAEEQGFTGFEAEELLVAGFLGVNRIPCRVVEDDAVLKDFHERDALVIMGGLEGFRHVLRVIVDGAGDEGGLGTEREKQWIDWVVDRAAGRGFGLGTFG